MNIIFDFGVVLLNLDFRAANKAFHALGAGSFEELYAYTSQTDLFNRLEIGAVTESEFCNEVRELTKISASNKQIINAWNTLLLDLPIHRMKLLSTLSKEHTLYLLSNTNRIHMQRFLPAIETEYGKGTFEGVFEKAYYSCNIGLRKPDKEIYEYIIKDAKLDLSNTIFIDDNAANIAAANNYGLKSILLPEGEDITILVERILNPVKHLWP